MIPDEKDISLLLRNYKAEIVQIVRRNLASVDMLEALLDYHENDVAAALGELEPEERQRVYEVIDADTLADILEYTDDLTAYLSELSVVKKADVLSRIETSAAVAYLEVLDQKELNMIIKQMPEEARTEITLLTSFDKNEIGSKMTTDYISIRRGHGVKGAMNELVVQAADVDNVSTIYVVDEKTLSLVRLLLGI